MEKLSKGFLAEKEIIFMGYSSRNQQYSDSIYQAFTNHGIKVYPVNKKENSGFHVKVYQHLSDLPKIPETAYILLNPENARQAVKQLSEAGVKKILFHNARIADAAAIEECQKSGIETAAGCPLMVLGTGFHKIHAFFAGVH